MKTSVNTERKRDQSKFQSRIWYRAKKSYQTGMVKSGPLEDFTSFHCNRVSKAWDEAVTINTLLIMASQARRMISFSQ